jgi:hypothetical protein
LVRLWLIVLAVLIVLGPAGWLVLRDRPPAPVLADPISAITPEPSASIMDSPSPSASPSPIASVPATPRASSAAARVVAPVTKKGVCVWDYTGLGTALSDVRAGWYYNWSAKPSAAAGSGAEFVPMIWGPGAVNATELNRAKASGKTLLGFNEPDFASQSNMSVERALELWPQLQATGLRLGSPAVAINAAQAGGWLDRFMSGARDRGLRVDFITVHWYGSDFSDAAVGHLRSYLRAVWERYRMPVWLTEFALIKFTSNGSVYPTDAQQANFITKATVMLHGLSYVERYAWFALPTPKEGHQGTGLYRGTTATPAGAAYRSAG